MKGYGFAQYDNYDGITGVYIVGFGDYIKIGWSKSIGRRLREIMEYMPEELHVYSVSIDATMKDEKKLHRSFKKLRIRNEWFWNKEPLTTFLIKHWQWISNPWTPTETGENTWDRIL